MIALGRTSTVAFVATVLFGTVRALLLLAQAWLIATVVAGAFIAGESGARLRLPMALLLTVVLLRAGVAWCFDMASIRCSTRVRTNLRTSLVTRIMRLGPAGSVEGGSGDLASLAVNGVDALDGYFSRYLPQVFLAAIVPCTVLVAVFAADWISAVIMIVTLPLIPVFMALIGMATRAGQERQLRALQMLAGHFLDVVGGLTTLKVFGRSKAQISVVGQVTDNYRRRLDATLRVSFLSSLVLELLASLSVALIAVSIGLRLLAGTMSFRPALFVLVLAPEAYMPLRQMAAEFHASAEGRTAAQQIFRVLDRPAPEPGPISLVPDPGRTGLTIESVSVTYPDRDRPVLEDCSLEVKPGEVLALAGPSGSGKSTLLSVLLCLMQPDSGRVLVGDVDLTSLDADAWRRRVAWVPQRPHLFAACLGDNIRLGRPQASVAEVNRAVARAGLTGTVLRLPQGLDTPIGENGAGLSAGERQRVALARAFVRDCPLLLLDEPTANLDGETEAEVLDAVRDLLCGRTVVIAAHRPSLLDFADRVVRLGAGALAA